MKKLIFPLVVLAAIVAIAAAFSLFHFFIQSTQRASNEVENQIWPDYPEKPLQVSFISNIFELLLPDSKWLSCTDRVVDFYKLQSGMLLGTEGGVLLSHNGESTRKAGRATGLPFTHVLGIYEAKDRVFIVGKEGYASVNFDVAQEPSGHGYRFTSIEYPSIVDAVIENNDLYLLTAKGDIYRAKDRKAELLCKTSLELSSKIAKLGNRFYVGTTKGNLYQLKLSTLKCSKEPIAQLQGAEGIRSLVSSDNTLWIGTDTGLYSLTENGLNRLWEGPMVTDIALHGDSVLFGTYSGQVLELTKKRPKANFAAPVFRIKAIDQEIFVGTGKGLFKLGSEKEKPIRIFPTDQSRSLSENYITALAFQKDQLLVGGLNSGIYRVDTVADTVTPLAGNLPGISAIDFDSSGQVLVGATNGFYELEPDGKIQTRFTKNQGLIHNNITGLLVKDKKVYAATAAGLSLIDKGSIQSIYAFHGLVNNHLYSLASDTKGVWVGTLGGLCRVGGESGLSVERCYTEKDGLTHLWITALKQRKKNLFIGTYGGGIMKLEPEDTPTLLKGSEKTSINLNAVCDTEHEVCFGSLENGVLYTINGKQTHALQEGLPSVNVTALASDGKRLAVGTDAGVIIFPTDLLQPEGWQ